MRRHGRSPTVLTRGDIFGEMAFFTKSGERDADMVAPTRGRHVDPVSGVILCGFGAWLLVSPIAQLIRP